jgi:hypothetical protein
VNDKEQPLVRKKNASRFAIRGQPVTSKRFVTLQLSKKTYHHNPFLDTLSSCLAQA